MTNRAQPADNLSIESRERIDAICLEFEDAWLDGASPDLAEYLDRATARERSALLGELMLVELEYRAPRGNPPALGDYLKRFPDLRETVEEVFRRGRADPAPARRNPGQHVGRYVIERSLGRGAFGEVYLARDELLERRVALKLAAGPAAAGASRITDEARMVARLDHPAVVPLYDAGQLDDGTVYLVMHYVDGSSLDRAADRAWSPTAIAELVARIAEALAAAHQQGLVHRDLKPANILVDRDGRAYLTDFGLALDEREQRRRAGECAGTPHYMAPEQIAGMAHRLDGRSDIWSLGVILYQLLTGRCPFDGETGAILRDEVLNRDPKPVRQIAPHIPAALERICLRCLAKEPGNRYATASDLARDLKRFCRGTRRARRRAWLAVAATAVLGTTLGLAAWWRPPATTLDGSFDLLVWKHSGPRSLQPLTETGALPLTPGDQIRLDVRLSRPAFIYIVWIDSHGEAMPVHPWPEGDWRQPPRDEVRRHRLALPAVSDEGWTMQPDSFGTETVLLLARQTPLPASVRIPELLANLAPVPSSRLERCARSRNGALVFARQREPRSPDLKRARPIDDPVLALHRTLDERLRPHFELVEALSFECETGPQP